MPVTVAGAQLTWPANELPRPQMASVGILATSNRTCWLVQVRSEKAVFRSGLHASDDASFGEAESCDCHAGLSMNPFRSTPSARRSKSFGPGCGWVWIDHRLTGRHAKMDGQHCEDRHDFPSSIPEHDATSRLSAAGTGQRRARRPSGAQSAERSGAV